MVIYRVNDLYIHSTLEIVKDEQILIRKKFDSLRILFEWLYEETSNESVKEMILELVSMKKWIKDSKFEFTEKV